MLDLEVISTYLRVALFAGVLTGFILGVKTVPKKERIGTSIFYIAVFSGVGLITAVTVLFLVSGFGSSLLT